MSYTSFVGAIEILAGHPQAFQDLTYLPEERPVVFQIFDNDEERFLLAAKRIRELEPDAIDINMGCSVRRISGRGAGAGLLRDPRKIQRIIHTLSNELDIPITAKIRLGWDHQNKNYLEVAKAVEDSGGSLIAVHARTRSQNFADEADWNAIAEIKELVSIPVIGNGNVQSPDDIDQLILHTSCDGVMIGRAAMGNPWIFQRRERDSVTTEELAVVINLHLTRMIDSYGHDLGLVRFRKHLSYYIKPLNLSGTTRRELLTSDNPIELKSILTKCGLPMDVKVGHN